MTRSSAARQLNQLLAKEDGDSSIKNFERKHSDLFRQMEKDGINRTAFWIRIASNRDPETGQ